MKYLFVLTFMFTALFGSGQEKFPKPNRFIVNEKVDTILARRADCFTKIKTSFNYYHIQLYNGQDINNARSVKADFQEKFPGEYVVIEWESPEFKVWAGEYETKLAAVQALQKIKKEYPDAFIVYPKKNKGN